MWESTKPCGSVFLSYFSRHSSASSCHSSCGLIRVAIVTKNLSELVSSTQTNIDPLTVLRNVSSLHCVPMFINTHPMRHSMRVKKKRTTSRSHYKVRRRISTPITSLVSFFFSFFFDGLVLDNSLNVTCHSIREYARRGCPTSLRAKLWSIILDVHLSNWVTSSLSSLVVVTIVVVI